MSEEAPKRMKRQNPGVDTPGTLKAAEGFEAKDVPKRRAAMLMVKPGEFMFLFTKGLKFQKNFKVIKGLPDDAKLIAVAPDSIRNGIMLVVTSAEFDEIPINVLPPVIPVEIDLDAIKQHTAKKKGGKKK